MDNIKQDGENNTQTNNVTNNYNSTNKGNFSALLGSNIEFDHNALKEIIILVHENISENDNNLENDFSSITINKKNKINNHSEPYFKNVVEEDFYPYFSQLKNFIQLKENKELQVKLESIIKDLNRKIIALQEDRKIKFEHILLNISSNIIDNNYDSMSNKESQILLLLYYFYTTCSIGKKK
jgi:hypothetical protein